MTITFADGTRIEVAASAFDDFVRHDLKWVEFVHGRASTKQPSGNPLPRLASSYSCVVGAERPSVSFVRLLKINISPRINTDNIDLRSDERFRCSCPLPVICQISHF